MNSNLAARIAGIAAVAGLGVVGAGLAAAGTGTTAKTGTTGHTGTTPTQKTTRLSTRLAAAQETPAPANADGAGLFTGTVSDGGKLTYRLTYSALSGGAVAAHIHAGAKGVAGPVLVTLCAKKCTSPIAGTLTVKASVVAALRAGTTYVNVHTAANPAGEIRGQVSNRR